MLEMLHDLTTSDEVVGLALEYSMGIEYGVIKIKNVILIFQDFRNHGCMTTTEIQSKRTWWVPRSHGPQDRRYKFEVALVLEMIPVQLVPGLFLLQIQDLYRITEDALAMVAREESMLFIRKEKLARRSAKGAVDIRHDNFNLRCPPGISRDAV